VNATRDRVLLAAGLVCVGAGAVLLFAPGAVPGLGPLEPLTDVDTATQVGLLLGLFVAVVAAFRMRRTAQSSLDRSGLLSTPPEQPDDATVPRPSSPLSRTYERVSDRIGRSGRSGWHVVAYGRRVRHTEEVTTEQPDPPQTKPGFPGAPLAPRVDRPRRPPAQQDGGQPLRSDRRELASDPDTGDGTPSTGEGGRRATERRPSVPDGRQSARGEESSQQRGTDRRPASDGRQPDRETGQTEGKSVPPEGQRTESRRATGRNGAQQPTRSQGRVDSDNSDRRGQGSRSKGRSAWEQRPTARQFRRRSREQLLELLDDVAETAQDTYATATDCDPTTAERAVATGEWTDDRVAAAFLATDRDVPGFTITERAAAWLGPQRTLDRRLARTLDAIESHADSYLTYESGEGETSQTVSEGEQE
jgi:hypothetical protein